MTYPKKKKGQRGPAKGPRKPRFLTPKKDEERVKTRTVTATDLEEEYLVAKYGTRLKAFRTLLPTPKKMIAFLEKYKLNNNGKN